VEIDPDTGCNTYSPSAEAASGDEWDEEDELEEWEEGEEEEGEEDDDAWLDDDDEEY
jgi:hypothetical protein